MLNTVRKKASLLPSYLKTWSTSFKGGLTLFCLLIMIIIPFISQRADYLHYTIGGLFVYAMIFAIYAASWDFLAGFVGQVSFGHAIFFGISGYINCAFIKYMNFPWWISIFLGAIISVLFGLLIGIPCLRLKGPYLALGTMSFGIIILSLFNMGSLKDFLGGTEGISGVPQLSANPVEKYFITFIFMIISFILLIAICKSKHGTVFKSIRDDETGAEASGINTTRYKIMAFMISAFFAGIAGSFYSLQTRGVNPSGQFGTILSFYPIIIVTIGGISTISGALLGAFIFVFLEEILDQIILLPIISEAPIISDLFQFGPILVFSIFLIIIIRFAERGLLNPAIEKLKTTWDLLIGK